jgi:hypothetical protein
MKAEHRVVVCPHCEKDTAYTTRDAVFPNCTGGLESFRYAVCGVCGKAAAGPVPHRVRDEA